MKYFLLFILGAFLSACKQEDDSAKPNEYAAKYVREFNLVDSFLIPLNKEDTLNDLERWLGLQSLQKGADSIHIRFLYEVYLKGEFVMAELKHDGKKWISEISRVTRHFNEEIGKVDTMTRVIKLDNPKSGWIKFINQLFELKILSIEDFDFIPRKDQVSVNDGDITSVEVATKNSYHSYDYPCAHMQNKKYWQVHNVNKIKELLYNEFQMLARFDKAIEIDFWKGVTKRRREIEDRQKESKGKIKLQEMIIQEVESNDTVTPRQKP